jgi:large subunit ribosomal protein L4
VTALKQGVKKMPKLKILNMQGAEVSQIELSDQVFAIKPNKFVVHELIVNYLANQRQGTQSAKTRSEVAGGGIKPWRQKGTGRARQGSIRAPQWRHGGIVFAPKPRDYSYTINKKAKRLAIKSVLSDKVQNGNLIILDQIKFDEYKTKAVINMLTAINAGPKVLIITPDSDPKTIKSASNIPGVNTTSINILNIYAMLKAEKLVITEQAVKMLEEVYA